MTRSLPARTRVLAAGVALLLTVGALAGCSDRPGQAADMTFTGLDGASHSIVVTEKDIDVVAKDMEPKPGQQTGQQRQTPTRVDIAGALIEAPIIEEVGKAHGITITDAEIVQLAKEQLGFEPRRASTLTYLRANLLFNQFRQQQAQAQAIVADLSKLRATMSGNRSPRYPDSAPAWWTQEDPRLQSANNPAVVVSSRPRNRAVSSRTVSSRPPNRAGPSSRPTPARPRTARPTAVPVREARTPARPRGTVSRRLPEPMVAVQCFSPGVNTVHSSGPWPSW